MAFKQWVESSSFAVSNFGEGPLGVVGVVREGPK